jgi:molecular chaperone GrpE
MNMTDKKKEKSEKDIQPQTDNQVKVEDSRMEKSQLVEKTEVKLIEGEEPQKLEYFSKDELVNKLKNLEKDLKETAASVSKFQTQANDWKEKFMRLQAEFENAQKRWDKNRQNLHIQYTASTLKSFLPLYDSFKKALDGNNPQKDLLKSFYDQFMNILKSHKAEPIKVKVNDLFDYNYHEALSSIEREDVLNNTIIDIIQDGWKLDKEVIRYAKVVITREPKPPEPESELEEKEELEKEKDEVPVDKKEGVSKETKTGENSKN